MQSTDMSGATIHAAPSLLPLRNVPVLQVEIGDESHWDEEWVDRQLSDVITLGQTLFHELDDAPFAIALTGLPHCSYLTLQKLADTIANLFRERLWHKHSMVIICEKDMAKALGQAIFLRGSHSPPVICIDQVKVLQGDYIDLVRPLAGEVIPITVKTLAFDEGARRGEK